MEAPFPPRQAERLAALHRYAVLDTPRESDFDDIVALASRICEVPISVINLIDSDRQWFKAEVGLGVRETPLATSLCAHAILEESFLEIPDTLADARTADNPLCAGEAGLRYYAGALLRSSDGLPLGTLCVLDKTPRKLTPLQVETLRVLAAQVMAQLELRLALRRESVLRRESDHRVKNSLAAIAALVRLQARAAPLEETKAALNIVRQRIDTVAALHGLMYQAEQGGQIDLGEYLPMVGRLMEGAKPEGVVVAVDAEPALVAPEMAGSLAIVVNELCTNAFKHAFPGNRTGLVRVTGRRAEEGYVLRVSDDGTGCPPAALDRAGGIGNAIVAASVAQLGGQLARLPAAQGLAVQVTLPL